MIHRSPIRIARDYNRALWLPVRWAHLVCAAIIGPVWALVGWFFEPSRRFWAAPIFLAAVLVPLVLPWDPRIRAATSAWLNPVGGDVKREIEAWQQYGGIGSLVIVSLLILLLDRPRGRRIADLAAAMSSAGLLTLLAKVVIGRPRPKYNDPFTFLWPGNQYPLVRGGHPVMMSTLSPGSSAELWSMPSSHTSAAAALTVFVSALYPRLRWLGVGMIGIVMIGRTMLGDPPAHWPSDVIAGACIGWLGSGFVVRYSLGSALLDRLFLTGRTSARRADRISRSPAAARPPADRPAAGSPQESQKDQPESITR